MSENGQHAGGGPFMRNIWGWKWSMISLVIIALFLGLAVCRYLVLKPERLIIPEKIERDV
jgi:hypothetical protein